MFHGPMWRGVRSVDWVTADAAGATLQALPRDGMLGVGGVSGVGGGGVEFVLDPVLLDAAGQLIGFWAADQLERARVVFPFRMASLEVLAPPPAAGEAFECRAAIELHGEQLVHSDIEVIGADGLCRLRLRGWEDKRFDVPPAFRGLTVPSRYEPLSSDWPVAAEAAGPGRVACRRMGVELGADAGLWKQVWACRVLGRREREVFDALTVPPRRQLEWLAARTAAKEAVSALVRDASGVELLPAEIEILPDDGGRPTVVGVEVGGLVPVVSLTHSGGDGAALAALVAPGVASGVTVGIDFERLTVRPGGFAHAVLTDRERPLLVGLAEDLVEEWQLRCWCAKEAAGKAVGTGLVPGTPEAPRVSRTRSGARGCARRGEWPPDVRADAARGETDRGDGCRRGSEDRMTELDPDVLDGVLAVLGELKEDWEYEEAIDPQTRFIADLGLESLEIVVLATMIQQQYGKLPFPAFFDEIGQRPVDERDVTVDELVAFVSEHRPAISQEA